MLNRIIAGDILRFAAHYRGPKFHGVLCDPPYELGFMNKSWDSRGVSFRAETWAAIGSLLEPGAHLLAFGGTRTFHRIAVAIEDAGFEIRDTLGWLYGCLSEDTELLIDGKWEPYHKAMEGGHALCYNKDNDEYQWQPIQDFVLYEYDDTAFRIASDCTDQIVSRNHRCVVEQGGKYTFKLAETLEREARIPVLEDVQVLLDNLPVPDARASGKEPVLLKELYPEAGQAEGTSCATQRPYCGMSNMRQRSLEIGYPAAKNSGFVLLSEMQWHCQSYGTQEALFQGTIGLDRNQYDIISAKNDWRGESGVEGRSHLLSQAWQLQTDQIRSMPGRVFADGAQGWLCDGASITSGQSHRQMPAEVRGRSSYQSRSSGQYLGEPTVICDQPRSQAIRASRFTKSDLAKVEAVHYRGKVWCIRVPSGAFVARRNGKVFITGNSGFPKSHDVSKAIDREAGAKRETIRMKPRPETSGTMANHTDTRPWIERSRLLGYHEVAGGEPATDAARAWRGYGTALKPAWEPVIVARNPLVGTVAQNALEHGAGALNIDGARVGDEEITYIPGLTKNKNLNDDGWRKIGQSAERRTSFGRWPANIIHDGSDETAEVLGDAARFFYCAKTGKREREEGLEGFDERRAGAMSGGEETRDDRPTNHPFRRNHHPTVKPLALTQYLAALILPPPHVESRILVPFAGSGSECIGAMLAGWRTVVGVEREAEYAAIARARLEHWKDKKQN
jgi:site-specific DNA-methyltransferase (adenine-specific)